MVAALALIAFALPVGAQASAKDPIVFVHGYTGNSANMKSRFVADSYTSDDFAAIDYGLYDSNIATASKVKAAVDALKASTGKSKVDIINASMGAVSSRYYLKFLGGTSSDQANRHLQPDPWVSQLIGWRFRQLIQWHPQ